MMTFWCADVRMQTGQITQHCFKDQMITRDVQSLFTLSLSLKICKLNFLSQGNLGEMFLFSGLYLLKPVLMHSFFSFTCEFLWLWLLSRCTRFIACKSWLAGLVVPSPLWAIYYDNIFLTQVLPESVSKTQLKLFCFLSAFKISDIVTSMLYDLWSN